MPKLFVAVIFAALADPIGVTIFARIVVIRCFCLIVVTARHTLWWDV